MRATAKDWLDAGAGVIFTQVGLKGAPELGGVENALDRATTKAEREILMALLLENRIGRAYAAPPGVPESRVRLLRQAFLNTLQDPRLEEEAKRLDLDINPLAGEEVQNVIAEIQHLSSDVKQKVRNFLEQP